MRRAAVLTLAIIAACWRSSAPPPAQPEEPPPPPVKATPAHTAPALSDVERLFQAFEGFADDMCNCTDMTCAQRVSDEMTKWSQEVAKSAEQPKLTDEETQRATVLAERLGRCMQNAMSGGAGGSATTP